MSVVEDYTDTLRAVGRYLTQVDATDVAIIEEPHELGLLWRGPDGRQHARRFAAGELWTLRACARLFRGTQTAARPAVWPRRPKPATPQSSGSPADPLGERLRALGAMADRLQATDVAIAETPDGYRFSGSQRGHRFTLTLTKTELIAHANRAFHHRSEPPI